MKDPTISLGAMDEENEERELDEVEGSSTPQHDIEETYEEDVDSLDDACDEEASIDLFVDMGTMGIDLDDDACKDLMEDEM